MVNKCLINWSSASIILAVEYKMPYNGIFLISFPFFVPYFTRNAGGFSVKDSVLLKRMENTLKLLQLN